LVLGQDNKWSRCQRSNGCATERIYDSNTIDFAAMLEVFRKKNTAAGLLGRAENQSIPKRKSVQPVEVNGSKNIGNNRSGDVKFGQQFHFAARGAGIDMQLSRDVHEILLQHLQGNDSSSSSPVLGHEIARASLLRGCRFVVSVQKDVGVEETTIAHASRHD